MHKLIIFILTIKEVCYQYWPDAEMKKHGNFAVEVVKTITNEGYIERIMSVVDIHIKVKNIVLYLTLS